MSLGLYTAPRLPTAQGPDVRIDKYKVPGDRQLLNAVQKRGPYMQISGPALIGPEDVVFRRVLDDSS